MTLREAWTQFVAAEDYEAHMAAIGQAQANASLVGELFEAASPRAGSRVLIAGAGSGQIFDWLPPQTFVPHALTCSDINAAFLKRLGRRCACQTVVDDIEDSRLEPGFSVAIVVLVLEHVEWRKALASLARLRPERVIVVIQRNPPGELPARERAGTMRIFASQVRSHPIEASALEAELIGLGFMPQLARERAVADGKTMVGLLFAATAEGSCG
jgi:hypothetical protein